MARVPGWASGALASGPPYSPRAGQVPTPVAFRGPPPPTMGASLRATPLGGPYGRDIGQGCDAPPKTSPAVATSTPAPGITPRRGHPLHAVSLRKGRCRGTPCNLHQCRQTPTPEYVHAAPATLARTSRAQTSEYVRAAPRVPAHRWFLRVFLHGGTLSPRGPTPSVVLSVQKRTCEPNGSFRGIRGAPPPRQGGPTVGGVM